MRDVPYSERFWAKVAKRGPEECWEWLGNRDKRWGYGRFQAAHRKSALAHRIAYELTLGPISEGLFVCHRCDNPPCVNPAHLFLGTHKDNMRDMTVKGRRARLKGEDSPSATITDEIVREIRAMASASSYASQCSEPKCGRPLAGRGLCLLHYSRRRRAGTLPERYQRPLYCKEIAAHLGITKKVVEDVLAGRRWSHVRDGES